MKKRHPGVSSGSLRLHLLWCPLSTIDNRSSKTVHDISRQEQATHAGVCSTRLSLFFSLENGACPSAFRCQPYDGRGLNAAPASAAVGAIKLKYIPPIVAFLKLCTLWCYVELHPPTKFPLVCPIYPLLQQPGWLVLWFLACHNMWTRVSVRVSKVRRGLQIRRLGGRATTDWKASAGLLFLAKWRMAVGWSACFLSPILRCCALGSTKPLPSSFFST